MKNSNWFVVVPLLLIALALSGIIHGFYPLDFLPMLEHLHYIIAVISVIPVIQNSAVLVYYRQKRTLIYIYALGIIVTAAYFVVSNFVDDLSSPDSGHIFGQNTYNVLIGIISIFYLIFSIVQVVLAYKLNHKRIRFWFGLIHSWGLASIFVFAALPFLIQYFLPGNLWFNGLVSMVGYLLLLVFYLELPNIKRGDEEEEIINEDDLLSKKDTY